MLAVQIVGIKWYKSKRSPQGAVERRKFLRPYRIDSDIVRRNSGELFVNRHCFVQYDKMFDETDTAYCLYRFGGTVMRKDLNTAKRELNRGVCSDDILKLDAFLDTYEKTFYALKTDNGYVIKWYALDVGNPVRKGINTDYNNRLSPCRGKRVFCETAFTLEKGDAGMIGYNYRFSSYHGQHYRQYAIFFVNTDEIHTNTFTKAEYIKKYLQLAVLF